jgi:Na+/proline symporter
VFGYSVLGGFPGVVRNDRFQMALILTAGAVVPLILWNDPPTTSVLTADLWLPQPLMSWPDDPLSNGRFIISLPLFVNLLFVNILVFPAQMRQWQMAAACKSPEDMRKGLIKGGIVNTVAWGMFIALGILVGLHYTVAPGETPNFDGILTMLSSSDSFLVSYVAFPLLFIACLAALLSTADSAIIPLAQVITDDCLDKKYHTIWIGRVVILGLLVFVLALYYIAFVYLGIDFMGLLFTVWGLLIVLAPAIGFAMLFPTMAKTTRGKVVGFCSIWVGFFLTLGIIIFATPGDGPEWLAWYPKGQPGVLYAGPIGVIVSGLIVALGLLQGFAIPRKNEPAA